MPRKSRMEAPPPVPAPLIAPVLNLLAEAVYLPEQIRIALRLRASSLRSEWRAGRLRIVRRCGRNFILGRDLLHWLEGGDLPSPAQKHGNGQCV